MVLMSWWFWILLWGALIICSLLYLAWFTYKALTRGFTLLDETVTWVESIEGSIRRSASERKPKTPARHHPRGIHTHHRGIQ